MRALRGIFIVWITVITVRYASVSYQSVRNPISPGTDIEWLMFWTVALIVLAALAAIFRYAIIPVAIVLACACVAVLILSGTLIAGVVTLWIFAAAYGCGQLILGRAGEAAVLAIPLGLTVLALAGFVLAAMHILTPVTVSLLLVASTMTLVRLKPVPIEFFSKNSLELSFPILMTAPVALVNFMWAVAPEIQYDANNYHLAVPRIYLSQAGFVNLPYFFHSYFFRLVEMLFTIGLALQGPGTAKLMSFVFGLVAASCVFVLGKLAFNTETGVWAAALFYTTPIVSWLNSTASNDIAVAMFLTSALIAILKFREDPNRTGWLYIAALLAGATIATKIDGAFGLIPLFAVFLFQTRKAKSIMIGALLLVIIAAPWYVLTFFWTGNPVFPLLNGLFKSPFWPIENRVMNASDFGIGTGLGALVRLPFRLIFDTIRFGEAAPRGTAGIALLLALPFSVVMFRDRNRRQATVFLVATAAIYMLLWAYIFQYLRYYTQILGVVCVLGAATAVYFRATAWMAIAIALQLITIAPQFWNFAERIPIAVALGHETGEHFLERTLDPYAAAQYLNRITKPGDKVLGVETDHVRFYLNAPLESLPESTLNGVLIRARSMPANGELAAMLGEAGFTYILTSRPALITPAPWYPYLQGDFLRQFAKLEFRDSNAAVYRLVQK